MRQKSKRMSLIGALLLVSVLLSSVQQVSAYWPWEKPDEPEYPSWDPQREWVAPPDEDPPTISLTVVGLYDTRGDPAGQATPTSSYTDDDGHFVRFFQFGPEHDNFRLRLEVQAKDGIAGTEEEQWLASGIDRDSVKLVISAVGYDMSESSDTEDLPNRATYGNVRILLTKGMKDVIVYIRAKDNAGNSAQSDRIKISVKSETTTHRKGRTTAQVEDEWESVKKAAKEGKGALRLDTTKNKWLYYARCSAYYDDSTVTYFSHPRHDKSQLVPDDNRGILQKDNYGKFDGRQIYYYWDTSGHYVGWLADHHLPGNALGTDGKKEVGGDYGGRFTGLGDD